MSVPYSFCFQCPKCVRKASIVAAEEHSGEKDSLPSTPAGTKQQFPESVENSDYWTNSPLLTPHESPETSPSRSPQNLNHDPMLLSPHDATDGGRRGGSARRWSLTSKFSLPYNPSLPTHSESNPSSRLGVAGVSRITAAMSARRGRRSSEPFFKSNSNGK